MALVLTSSAFHDGETIPRQFTCDGDKLAPRLMCQRSLYAAGLEQRWPPLSAHIRSLRHALPVITSARRRAHRKNFPSSGARGRHFLGNGPLIRWRVPCIALDRRGNAPG